jgi:hypothetical protein
MRTTRHAHCIPLAAALLWLGACAGPDDVDPAGSTGAGATNGSSGGGTSTGSSSGASSGATSGSTGGSTGGAQSTGSPSCDAPGQVFSVHCTQCHDEGAAGGLNLLAPCQLLQPGQDSSSGCPQSTFIVPGQPSGSLLWQLVTCTGDDCPCVQPGFGPMPYQPNSLGIGPLSAAEQTCIADWISSLDGGISQCESL